MDEFPGTGHLRRRAVLFGAAALLTTPALANAPLRSPMPPRRPDRMPAPALAGVSTSRPAGAAPSIESLLARANLGGTVGFAAIDTATGQTVDSLHAGTALPPASVAKAPTAHYAMSVLGADHRFVTRVLARGEIVGDTLRGDLVLQGGGDPALQTADLAHLAQALVARGLRRVDGRFLVDESALPLIRQIDAAQEPQAGYNPAISGMNLNFNRVHFAWSTRGGQVALSLDARSTSEVPPVSVIRITAANRDLPVYTHDDSGAREEWTVARSAMGTDGSRWLPVRRPGLHAGDVLRALLMARGCAVPAPQPGRAGGTVLAERASPPLSTMMRDMLRYSTNLTAECVGLTASRQLGATADTLAASGQQMGQWLASAQGSPGFSLVDHSGLGDASRVSAAALARFFLRARGAALPGLLREQPLRDEAGRAMTSAGVSVAAKTGTLNFVSGLGGYARISGGREIAFAILCADVARRAAIAPGQRENPPGARAWAGRARTLQQALIHRWSVLAG